MKTTGTLCLQALKAPSIPTVLSAALFGAAAILFVGSGQAHGEESGTADVASAADVAPVVEIAAVPLPLARPVQPGEVPLVGVGAIAEQYAMFQNAVSEAMGSRLGTPNEVRRMIDKLRFPEAGSAAQAWLAHRGLIAAQDPAFAEGVRRAVTRHGAISVLDQLTGRGSFARNLHGADSAVAKVMSAIQADNTSLSELRGHFLAAAQTFQGNRWGMIDEPAEALSTDFADAGEASPSMGQQFSHALDAFSPISPALAYAPPLMERVLAYGARHIIATDLETEVQSSELSPPAQRTTSCLNWAKLNLNQCMAAAHFPSEEAWCAGTHAIEDVRACWAGVLPKADR
jgi:hypothetical protein